jgi:hypothetical protein
VPSRGNVREVRKSVSIETWTHHALIDNKQLQ